MSKIKKPYSLITNYSRIYKAIERPSSREFNGMVEKFWVSNENYGYETFEILPDGNFDLVFIIDDLNCKLLFAGPYTKISVVPICIGKEYFGIRFKPGKMPRITDIKPGELVDTMITLPKIFGIDIDIIGERLLALKTIDSKQEFMESIFKKLGQEFFIHKDLCSRSTDLVELYRGKIKVKDLAGIIGASTRTLERHFLDQVGLSPKAFIRLVRFQNTIKKLKNGTFAGLADLAYECGYTDQSHFIKDFKQFSGKSPGCVR